MDTPTIYIDLDNAKNTTEQQFIEFLQKRVQGKTFDWYIVYFEGSSYYGDATYLVFFDSNPYKCFHRKADTREKVLPEKANDYGVISLGGDHMGR